jgi:hypothetical protein
MARRAISAVGSPVFVIRFVTGITGGRGAFIHSIDMARGTGYRRMSPCQREIGLGGMVDGRGGPTGSGVAAGAVGAHFCAVRRIRRVARITGGRSAFIHSIDMARGTDYRRMSPCQREIGLGGMVDGRGGPTGSGVAAGAVGAHFCAVRRIRRVARITGCGSAFIYSIDMARGAGYRHVFARQWKGSGRVVYSSLCPGGRIVA